MSMALRHNPHILHVVRDESLHCRGKMQSEVKVTGASDVSLVFELKSKLQKERYLYIDVE